MLTLYHSPRSRSTRVVRLIDDLGALDRVTVEIVTIPRQDGTGGRDPKNPHAEGKVPYLVHDGVGIRETNAIMVYLTELFPEAGLGPMPGDAQRGAYLGWMAYYGNVLEPALVLQASGISNPITQATFRDMAAVTARLTEALEHGPYLLGETYSAADILLASPFVWFPQAMPDVPAIRDWVARVQDRPSVQRTEAFDTRAVAA